MQKSMIDVGWSGSGFVREGSLFLILGVTANRLHQIASLSDMNLSSPVRDSGSRSIHDLRRPPGS